MGWRPEAREGLDGMLLHKCMYAVYMRRHAKRKMGESRLKGESRRGMEAGGRRWDTQAISQSLILIRAQTSDVNPQHDGAVGDSSPILLPDSGILESKRRPGKIIQ